MLAATPLISPRNRILNALPPEEFQRITAKLKNVEIPSGEILYNVGEPINHIYFPETPSFPPLIILKTDRALKLELQAAKE